MDVGGQVHAQAEHEDPAAPVRVPANNYVAALAGEPTGLQLRALPDEGQPLEGSAEIGVDHFQPQLISDRRAPLYTPTQSGHDTLYLVILADLLVFLARDILHLPSHANASDIRVVNCNLSVLME